MLTAWSRWKYELMACGIVVAAGGCAAPDKTDATYPEPLGPGALRWDFDTDPTGRVPPRWDLRETNPSQWPAEWQVIADATAPSAPNAFALTTTENYNSTFNLAIAQGSSVQDFDLTVRVKAIRGTEDQGGGPIWRCRDENNYYTCRFNPLESNYRVYKVVDGRRKQLDSARVFTEAGEWYTIRVTMVGPRITCHLDGRRLLEAEDDTLPQGGRVGLWTKADAVTSFDDLIVKPLEMN